MVLAAFFFLSDFEKMHLKKEKIPNEVACFLSKTSLEGKAVLPGVQEQAEQHAELQYWHIFFYLGCLQ